MASSKRMGVLMRRRERFQSTLDALERLLAWTRAERASFTERFLGEPHSRQLCKDVKKQLPDMHVDKNVEAALNSKDAVHNSDSDSEDVDIDSDIDIQP